MREAYTQGISYSGYLRYAPNVTGGEVKSHPRLEPRVSGVPCLSETWKPSDRWSLMLNIPVLLVCLVNATQKIVCMKIVLFFRDSWRTDCWKFNKDWNIFKLILSKYYKNVYRPLCPIVSVLCWNSKTSSADCGGNDSIFKTLPLKYGCKVTEMCLCYFVKERRMKCAGSLTIQAPFSLHSYKGYISSYALEW